MTLLFGVVGVIALSLPFQPADITIVKSMKNPPMGVKLVMAAVCVMKGIAPEKIIDPMGTGQRVRHVFLVYCVQICSQK